MATSFPIFSLAKYSYFGDNSEPTSTNADVNLFKIEAHVKATEEIES